MDRATFLAVHERLEELAAVDHNGLNFKKLNQLRPPWWMRWRWVTAGADGRGRLQDGLGWVAFVMLRCVLVWDELHNAEPAAAALVDAMEVGGGVGGLRASGQGGCACACACAAPCSATTHVQRVHRLRPPWCIYVIEVVGVACYVSLLDCRGLG